jgi:hypothetical protein
MAPPKDAQRDVHARAGDLYASRVVDTSTSLGQLIKLIAKKHAGMSDLATRRAEAAVKKAIHRAYPDDENRLGQLWQGLVSRAELPTGNRDYIDVADDVLVRLKAELRGQDPLFAAFNAALASAEAAQSLAAREAALRHAADALRRVLPPSRPPADDEDRRQRIERLSRISGAWGSVYDAAVGDTGDVPTQMVTMAEDAIKAGFAAQQAGRSLRQTPSWGRRRSEGPRRVGVGTSNVWAAAVAVLGVLQGVPAEELVSHTRTWSAANLGVAPDRVSPGDVLAQAAATLMRIGRRGAAKEALEIAWDTGDTNHVWEELLDLGISLAAWMYGLGERAAAAAVLSPVVREWLDGEYPGDPDEGWGASVDYRLYRLLIRVLDDPHEAVGALRWAWTEDVGEGGYRRRLWVLTAILVETLVQVRNDGEAASLAQVAPALLPAPSSSSDRQAAAHLSEMCTTERTTAASATTDRVAALLQELITLVVRDPRAVDHGQRHVLEGLAALATAARREGRLRRRDAA